MFKPIKTIWRPLWSKEKRMPNFHPTCTFFDTNLEFLLSKQIPYVPGDFGLKVVENDSVSLSDSLCTFMSSVTMGSSNLS